MEEEQVVMLPFLDVARNSVDLIQQSANISRATQVANACFPTMPNHMIGKLYYHQVVPRYTDDGNTITSFHHYNSAGLKYLNLELEKLVSAVLNGRMDDSQQACNAIRILCGY